MVGSYQKKNKMDEVACEPLAVSCHRFGKNRFEKRLHIDVIDDYCKLKNKANTFAMSASSICSSFVKVEIYREL